MIRDIWVIWFQGRDKMPQICETCYSSWVDKNPNWRVNLVHDGNIQQYIPEDLLKIFSSVKPIQCYSDLVRLYLVYRYGGLYVDATLFCHKPVEDWLPEALVEDCFIQWDFDSKLPSINCLYSNVRFNNYFRLLDFDAPLKTDVHKVTKLWHKGIKHLRKVFKRKQAKQFGKSSNNTRPKQGVKIIANSFKLMNSPINQRFKNALVTYPYFKLTWKNIPKGDYKQVFKNNSKFLKLLGLSNDVPKIVWVYWGQGEGDPGMHPLNRDCIRRWREFNPEWDVRVLDDTTVSSYAPEYLDIVSDSKATPAACSDVLRLLLLKRFGGVWVDASVYPMVPLRSMLPKVLNDTGFFTYRFIPRSTQYKGVDDLRGHREIVSWFLVVDRPEHPVINKWADKYITRFKEWPEKPKYFQIHDDLACLYDTDSEIKEIIDNMVQISEKLPHSALRRWRNREPSFVYKRPKRYRWRNEQSQPIPNIDSQ
tara:strand:- start:316 stop:1749 length:1434 start_codon:yes stop_codon:yes gene_type:complete